MNNIVKFEGKKSDEVVLNDFIDAACAAAAKEIDDAWAAWKTIGYRDYQPMLAWLVAKGLNAQDAEDAIQMGFRAGFYWPEL